MVTPVKDESLVEHAGAGQGADNSLHEIVHRQQRAPPQAHHLIEMILVLPIQRQIRRHPGRLPLGRVVVGSEVAGALDALELVSVPRRWEVRRVRRARCRRDHEGAVLCIRHDPLHRLVADDRGCVIFGLRAGVRDLAGDRVHPVHVVVRPFGSARLVAHPKENVPARWPAAGQRAHRHVPAVLRHRWRVQVFAEICSRISGAAQVHGVRVGRKVAEAGDVHAHAAARQLLARRGLRGAGGGLSKGDLLDRLVAAAGVVRVAVGVLAVGGEGLEVVVPQVVRVASREDV